jgi:hypothetical protein
MLEPAERLLGSRATAWTLIEQKNALVLSPRISRACKYESVLYRKRRIIEEIDLTGIPATHYRIID